VARKSVTNLSDQEIIMLVLSGQKEQYKELVRRYQDKIYRYTTYLIGSSELAQDATQSAFIKVYINLNGYDNAYKFSSWLYRIAHNEAISLVRKEKHFSTADLTDLPEIVTDEPQHLDQLTSKEDREQLFQALQEIPADQREALLLYYLEGKSYEEIAEIMCTNKNNVGSRISRAKKKVAKILKD
jgi:RNA polymerase sigma-70 factor (ECF subfamily)